jgi:hypothetical protein
MARGSVPATGSNLQWEWGERCSPHWPPSREPWDDLSLTPPRLLARLRYGDWGAGAPSSPGGASIVLGHARSRGRLGMRNWDGRISVDGEQALSTHGRRDGSWETSSSSMGEGTYRRGRTSSPKGLTQVSLATRESLLDGRVPLCRWERTSRALGDSAYRLDEAPSPQWERQPGVAGERPLPNGRASPPICISQALLLGERALPSV